MVRKFVRATKQAENAITPLQETIIRRINRKLQIERRGNKLTAILPQPSERTTKGQVETQTYNRYLTVENTGDGFRAVIHTKTFWKRVYWRKWREETGNKTEITSDNFNILASQIKQEF